MFCCCVYMLLSDVCPLWLVYFMFEAMIEQLLYCKVYII